MASDNQKQSALLYHMVQSALWNSHTPQEFYYPPTYQQDGFTHLTADPAMLLSVANHFYQQSEGAWMVLELDASRLEHEVKYEAAAPVGSTEAHDSQQLFPHLYGGINPNAVTGQHPMERDASGRFLGVPTLGLTA